MKTKKEINSIVLNCLLKYNPEKIGIFGSYARNQQSVSSDLDIIIKLKDTISLLQLIKIENELSDCLGIKVDLLTEGAITNSRIKQNISKDLKIIYMA